MAMDAGLELELMVKVLGKAIFVLVSGCALHYQAGAPPAW